MTDTSHGLAQKTEMMGQRNKAKITDRMKGVHKYESNTIIQPLLCLEDVLYYNSVHTSKAWPSYIIVSGLKITMM